MKRQKISVVIVAAGSGKRMKTNLSKQFITLKGKSILNYTIERFQNSKLIDEIILVLSEDYVEYYKNYVDEKNEFTKVKITIGGENRMDSVYNGLKNVDENSEIVLIHDGVRPFVSEKIISDVISNTKLHGAVIPAVEVKDTIKKQYNNFIIETLNRNELISVQTPQGFRKNIILEAFEKLDYKTKNITDDASLVESMGAKVFVVKGDYFNIKITTQEDLLFGNLILNNIENKKQ